MKNKQNRTDIITPKKNISRVNKLLSSNKNDHQSTQIKDFLPPFLQNILTTLPSLTPLKKQPQFLLSPSPVKKDLFSQLLGSQRKSNSPYLNHTLNFNQMIMEQQDNEYMEDQSGGQNSETDSQMSQSQNDCIWDQQNQIKKRKRKSTAQIKLLKQQLDGQMNWTKQKIMKMAQVTGLSQSQVYKWCWDQKKKIARSKQSHKRKLIKKQFAKGDHSGKYEIMFGSRNDRREEEVEGLERFQNIGKKIISYEEDLMEIRTKPKLSSILQEISQNTEKKINKKLIFY